MSSRIHREEGSEKPAGNRLESNTPGPQKLPLPKGGIPAEILTYLDAVFPDRLALIDALGSPEAAKGARAVVEHLREVKKELDAS